MNFNNFMTYLMYITGVGVGIYAIRNYKNVSGLLSGVLGPTQTYIQGIATIPS